MNKIANVRKYGLSAEAAVTAALFAALVVLCIYFASRTPVFLTISNLSLALQNGAPLAVIAVPMMFLMITGNIDLSVGSTVGLAGTMTAIAVTEWGTGSALAVVVGILVGALVGTVNGVLCATLHFNPIIVTIGMLGLIRGLTLIIHTGDIYIGSVSLFTWLGNGEILGIPVLVYVAATFFGVGGLFLRWSPWGRHIYAIGANPRAAFLSALAVRALPFSLYVATGAAAGVSGVMLTARISGASPGSQGLGMEFDALTLILLGGISFAGGRGRLLGALIAWVFLALLQDGLILTNVQPNAQKVASGSTLIVAASLDAFTTYAWPGIQQRRAARRRRASEVAENEQVHQTREAVPQ